MTRQVPVFDQARELDEREDRSAHAVKAEMGREKCPREKPKESRTCFVQLRNT